jgi:hypothetical protein
LAQRLATDFSTDARFDNPRAVQLRLTGFDLDRLQELGRNVRDLYAQGSSNPERVAKLVDDAYLAQLAAAVTGGLGGKVGVAPRLFLRKLVGDILDRVDADAPLVPDVSDAVHGAEQLDTLPGPNAVDSTAVDVGDLRPSIGAAAPVGSPLSPAELQLMIDNGYHTSVFGDQIAPLYDRAGATLGGPNSDVWAMPAEDATKISSVSQAARETGMAKTVLDAYLNGADVYAVHFPVEPSALRRPTLSDSGGWPHFFEDPNNLGATYGHTAVNTGHGSYLLNETRETLVQGGRDVPSGSVLTRLQDGSWVVVRRY